jgi:hypothetical protein
MNGVNATLYKDAIFILTLETTISFTGSPFFHQITNSHIKKGKHLHLYDDSLEYEDDDFFEDADVMSINYVIVTILRNTYYSDILAS